MRRVQLERPDARVEGHRWGREAHLLAWPTLDAPFPDQLAALEEAIPAALAAEGLELEGITLVEAFLSDPANQIARLDASPMARWGAFARRGMPPRPPARLAARVIHHQGATKTPLPEGLLVDLGPHRELWLTDLMGAGADAEAQTVALLEALVARARALGFEPFERLLRTWIYVHDIDTHYAGMVSGRAQIYEGLGFEERARFPASTGIGGSPVDPARWVTVNALLADLPAEALRRVHAPAHLPPASSYGVAFDRALSVRDDQKRAIHLSGTASIDAEGRILHDDVVPQARRTVENIAALLTDAGAAPRDLAWIWIYLRDIREADRVEAALEALGWGSVPKLILQGPVCRPGWLIEIEGVAWIPLEDS